MARSEITTSRTRSALTHTAPSRADCPAKVVGTTASNNQPQKRPCEAFLSLRSSEAALKDTTASRAAADCIKLVTPTSVEVGSRGIYALDGAYVATVDQAELYEGTIRRCLKAVQNGNSSTVFNYGQSGTGKTYTTVVCSEEVLRELLAACDQEGLLMSVVEEYQNKLSDMLDGSNTVKIVGNGMQGQAEKRVTSVEGGFKLIGDAMAKRRTGRHDLNDKSSRSHLIIVFKLKTDGATFSLVDLAGTEKLRQTGAEADSEIGKEGRAINKSLSVLGKIFSELANRGPKAKHISYRESTLTRALQTSLTGHGCLQIIGHVNSDLASEEETAATVKFVTAAMKVLPKAAPAAKPTGMSKTGLQTQLVQLQSKYGKLQSENAGLQSENADLRQQLTEARAQLSTAAPAASVSLPLCPSSQAGIAALGTDATSQSPSCSEDFLIKTEMGDEKDSWLSHGPSAEAQLAEVSAEMTWAVHSHLEAKIAQIARADQRHEDLKAKVDCMSQDHGHALHKLQEEAAAGHTIISDLRSKLHRAQESQAAITAEGDSAISILQPQLLACAASEEPVSLNIAVLDGTDRICQLEADMEASQRRHADDLAQAQDELSSTGDRSDMLELQLEHTEQQLHAAQSEAESQTGAANSRIRELQGRHSEEIHDLVEHASFLAADARKDQQQAANEVHVLQGTIVQLRLQQSLSLWNIGAAVTTLVSRRIFGPHPLP